MAKIGSEEKRKKMVRIGRCSEVKKRTERKNGKEKMSWELGKKMEATKWRELVPSPLGVRTKTGRISVRSASKLEAEKASSEERRCGVLLQTLGRFYSSKDRLEGRETERKRRI